MSQSTSASHYEFLCLDRLFRWVDGGVSQTAYIWELAEALAVTPVDAEQYLRGLQRKRLVVYVPPEDEVRLTQIGIAMVLQAHANPEAATAYFGALKTNPLNVPALITDGSLPADSLKEMTVQLDGMIAALEGRWSQRFDLSSLIDELDLRLWNVNSLVYFAIDDLTEIADILSAH
jgi:hypothetical protein